MFSMVLVGSGSSHFFIRIRIQGNDTDSTVSDPDPQHCLLVHGIIYIYLLWCCEGEEPERSVTPVPRQRTSSETETDDGDDQFETSIDIQ